MIHNLPKSLGGRLQHDILRGRVTLSIPQVFIPITIDSLIGLDFDFFCGC